MVFYYLCSSLQLPCLATFLPPSALPPPPRAPSRPGEDIGSFGVLAGLSEVLPPRWHLNGLLSRSLTFCLLPITCLSSLFIVPLCSFSSSSPSHYCQ